MIAVMTGTDLFKSIDPLNTINSLVAFPVRWCVSHSPEVMHSHLGDVDRGII